MNRFMTILGSCLLALAVTAPAMGAQTPIASPVASADGWAVTDVRAITVDGQPVAMSPDGRWIAGVGPNDLGVCIWDVASLKPTCASSDLRPDPFTFAWAPDSSAIVFADGQTLTRDPKPDTLWRYSPADRSLVALSRDRVHRAMAWTQDSERVLFLTMASNARGTNMMHVGRDGGDVVRMRVPQLFYLGPLQPLDDGSVLFTSVDEHGAFSIWQADMNGDAIEKIAGIAAPETAAPSQVAQISEDRRHVLMWRVDPSNERTQLTWLVVNLETGETVLIAPASPADAIGGMRMLPDGDIGIAFAQNDGETEVHVFSVDLRTGVSYPVSGEGIDLPGSLWRESATSDGRQRLLVADGNAVVITLAPAS